MTEVGLATLNPPSGAIKQGSIGPPIGGFSDRAARRGRRPGRAAEDGRPDLDPHPQPHGRLLGGARGDRRGRARRLARLRRPRPRRRGRLPLVLRPQEAGDRPRRLQHQPARGRGGAGRAPRGRPGRRRSASTTPSTARTSAPTSPCAEGAERPSSADLIVFCRERVGYKAPEEVVFLDEMPLNPTGKIDRVGLKRMAEDHLHPHGLD